MGRFRIAAVLVGIFAVLVQAADGQGRHEIRVARWDVILNENGFESLDGVDSRTVDTASNIYQGAVFKANDLRAAINAGAAAGGFDNGSQSMAFTQDAGNGTSYMLQQLSFGYYQGTDAHLALKGEADGTETYAYLDGGDVHIKLNYPRFNVQVDEVVDHRRSQTPLNSKASIFYDGQLSPGDALAFCVEIKGKSGASYRHLVVWEVFKIAERYEQYFQLMEDPQRWCQLGPEGICNDADIALIWAAGAKHAASAVSAKWEQKLEDGKVIRLIGVTRSDKWLYCWWDGDGLPVASTNWIQIIRSDGHQPVSFAAEVTGSADEWGMQSPTGHLGTNGGRTGPFIASIANTVDRNGAAVVGVPVGPWEMVGEIKKGESIKIGDVKYTLGDVQDIGNNFVFAQFYGSKQDDQRSNVVVLSAVRQDGTEIDPNAMQSIIGKNYGDPQPIFQGLMLKDLKALHVWKRKMQWVKFSGFATEPVTSPMERVATTHPS